MCITIFLCLELNSIGAKKYTARKGKQQTAAIQMRLNCKRQREREREMKSEKKKRRGRGIYILAKSALK